MKIFSARVVDSSGKKIHMTEEAISRQLFEESLTNRGLFIIEIKEIDAIQKNLFTTNRLNKKFLLDFSYNVYSLLEFGIDINEVFKILSDIYISGQESKFINEIRAYLKKGEKLSTAIKNSKSGDIFDDFFITMISSGEHSGNLTDAFKLIHAYFKNNQKIKEKLLSASVYPLILLVISIFAINFLFFFIIPNFNSMYQTLGFEPSRIIKIMFNLSDWLRANPLLYFVSIITIVVGFLIYFQTKASKVFIRTVLQQLPIISQVTALLTKIKISFSLEILLKGGSSLEEAIYKLSEIERDELIKKEYHKGLKILKEGGSVRETFKSLKIYNLRDLNIIEIADSISKTKEGFEKIHTDASYNLEVFLEKLFELINPVMMIFIAFFLFFVMYLVISPTLIMLQNTM